MTIKAITELRKIHEEMGRVLDELEFYEDGIDVDWSQIVIDYKWLVNDLRHRLISLKQRGQIQ